MQLMDHYEDNKFLNVLRRLAPGTPLREGLENVLRAGTGGLIVVGDTPAIMQLMDGGFHIDVDLSPANLYELAKMDGAIILSHDARRILYANVQLVPNPSVPSSETGIRHRTAERVARQTGEVVVSISQRRNIITMYQATRKYALRDTAAILNKANQALQTLERYKTILEQSLTNLGALEFEGLVSTNDVVIVIQRMEIATRIAQEIEYYIVELGVEGRLIAMQLQETEKIFGDETLLMLRDFAQDTDPKQVMRLRQELHQWESEDILDGPQIARHFGLPPTNMSETLLPSRGYRLLHKLPRLPMSVIENLVDDLGSLQAVLSADVTELDDVEGIGEVRARAIMDGLQRLQDQLMLDRHL